MSLKGEINKMIKTPKPENVMKIFFDLTKIPRGSGNMDKVAEYCENFAKKHNLWYIRDEKNNVIIKKDASAGYENYKSVILQGHLDMVCEKESDCTIDFLNDPLLIDSDGGYIFAKGTTLGADDGIAVAYILAVLEDDTIKHPPLEALFTTDEETGMDGAIALDTSLLEGKMLLNIDSEEEGIFTVSCAGGMNVSCNIPISFGNSYDTVFDIRIYNLLGGHSGVEIDKKRANANILAGALLDEICTKTNVGLVKINGGKKHNAIPTECIFSVCCHDKEAIENITKDFLEKIREKYKGIEPDIKIEIKTSNKQALSISAEDTKRFAKALSKMPDGVKSLSEDILGLVKTSSNLGILTTNENGIYMLSSVRSSDEREKEEYSDEIFNHMMTLGDDVKKSDEYPAWEYKSKSYLRDKATEIFEKMYNKKPVTQAIHAGLECGIFSSKIKGLDAISFGPDIKDIHTPKERLSIASAERTWEFLIELLKELKVEKSDCI